MANTERLPVIKFVPDKVKADPSPLPLVSTYAQMMDFEEVVLSSSTRRLEDWKTQKRAP